MTKHVARALRRKEENFLTQAFCPVRVIQRGSPGFPKFAVHAVYLIRPQPLTNLDTRRLLSGQKFEHCMPQNVKVGNVGGESAPVSRCHQAHRQLGEEARRRLHEELPEQLGLTELGLHTL